jgi:hypothetical protein
VLIEVGGEYAGLPALRTFSALRRKRAEKRMFGR